MADKEATVYVVDVGRSMGDKHSGRSQSDLDYAMQYVWDGITAAVATARKTLNIGVLGFRTDDTKNPLDSEEGYDHIAVYNDLQQILMPDIRDLHSKIKPSKTKKGDAISGIVVAQHMLSTFCKKLKFKKKIVLLTNGDGGMELEPQGLSAIAAKLKEDGMQLVILGVDFDDEEYGFKEEGKSTMKRENEAGLKQLASECDGAFGTLKEAIDELGTPRIHIPKPVATYKGQLQLGDSATYDTSMRIDVERYPKTKVATAPTGSKFLLKIGQPDQPEQPAAEDVEMEDATDENQGGYMHANRVYEIKDESKMDGKREVERNELAKGYTYGNTAVHIEDADQNITKLETSAGLDLVGFIPQANHRQYLNMSPTSVIIAQRTNPKAQMAFASFVHALYEVDSYAIARFVSKDWRPPVLLLLAPVIESGIEYLIDVELPYAEDFRQHKFPPLDRIVTTSGKIHYEHRNLPTKELRTAMDDFVDSMDLSTADEEDGEPAEAAKIENTFSTKLHRIHQAVKYRAVNPDQPVPPAADILIRFSRPPDALLKTSEAHIKTLSEAANVKKVPPRARGRAAKKNMEQPKSGLDVAALLNEQRGAAPTRTLSETNAVAEFRQMFDDAANVDTLQRAVEQLGAFVRKWVAGSMGDAAYARAVEAVRVMRDECTELEVAGMFNGFLEEFKRDVFGGKLGGDRREMWFALRQARVLPIAKGVDGMSEYGEEEARQFMLPDRTLAAE